MTDLVTDAAEIAAAHVMDDPHQIEIALRAAAPYIAAEALRDAAQQVYDRFCTHTSTDAQAIVYMIARMADELEAGETVVDPQLEEVSAEWLDRITSSYAAVSDELERE